MTDQVRLEYGPAGREHVEMGAGDYFCVPRHLIHREGNVSEQPAELVLVRVGEGRPVFAVDGPPPS
jgi:uncharacterized RmlC-like cupin family protein